MAFVVNRQLLLTSILLSNPFLIDISEPLVIDSGRLGKWVECEGGESTKKQKKNP
jgi:hypothetical protein